MEMNEAYKITWKGNFEELNNLISEEMKKIMKG